MREFLYRMWAKCFGYPMFSRLNSLLFQLGLRGLGVLNYHNVHTSGEAAAIQGLLRGIVSPKVVDVGANEGDFAEEILKTYPKARLLCVEPGPRTVKRLRNRLQPYAEVIICNVAATEFPGTMHLHDYEGSEGSSHATLVAGAMENFYRSSGEITEVSCLPLDQILTEHQFLEIDLLKIDVEGFELSVLKGAGAVLKSGKIRAIQFEMTGLNVMSRTFFRDLKEAIGEDYRFFRILPHGLLELRGYDPLKMELFAYQNILAIQKAASA